MAGHVASLKDRRGGGLEKADRARRKGAGNRLRRLTSKKDKFEISYETGDLDM
jgi:hypothetical protein